MNSKIILIVLGALVVLGLMAWGLYVLIQREGVVDAFASIGDKVTLVSKKLFKRLRPSNRMFYLFVSISEILGVALIFGWIINVTFGGGFNAYIVGIIVWAAILGYTRLINKFFVVIPKNSGGVVIDYLRTYEPPATDSDVTQLKDTRSLREVGPGLQGILLWEGLGWVIDLGKHITLGTDVTAPSKDNIELVFSWQVMLTPARGKLVNLVRHDLDTINKFFDGQFRGGIVEIASGEYAQAIAGHPSVFERINELKEWFRKRFGGPSTLSDDEKQFGTYTNDPQLLSIKRSTEFQKSVENLAISKNNAAAIGMMREHLNPNQALIAVLTAQGKPTENLWDINVQVDGLQNLRDVNIGSGMLPFMGKGNKSKKKVRANE